MMAARVATMVPSRAAMVMTRMVVPTRAAMMMTCMMVMPFALMMLRINENEPLKNSVALAVSVPTKSQSPAQNDIHNHNKNDSDKDDYRDHRGLLNFAVHCFLYKRQSIFHPLHLEEVHHRTLSFRFHFFEPSAYLLVVYDK